MILLISRLIQFLSGNILLISILLNLRIGLTFGLSWCLPCGLENNVYSVFVRCRVRFFFMIQSENIFF